MASYKDIQGFNIQNLTSDPVPFAQDKENNPYGGVWSSGGNLPTGRSGAGAFGTQTAAVVFGGEIPAVTNTADSYNGTSWSPINSMNVVGYRTAGLGTQAAGKRVASGPAPYFGTAVEDFDGTNWTSGTNLTTPRAIYNAAGGTQTASIVVSGFIPSSPFPTGTTANVESWNGSAWTEVTDVNRSRIGAYAGTQTAGVFASGAHYDSAPSITNVTNTEIWNGTSWTEVAEVNFARRGHGSSGISTSAIIFSGSGPGPNIANTESYDGTSWTEVNDVGNALNEIAAATGSPSSISIKIAGSGPSNLTEEWTFSGIPPTTPAVGYSDAIIGQIYYNSTTGSFKAITAGGAPLGAWSSGGNLNTTRGSNFGFGASSTSALTAGGADPISSANTVTETYNGTAWTEVNDLNTGAQVAGSFGTLTAGIKASGNGSPGVFTTSVESWDGTNWTEVNELNTSRGYGRSCGTQTAGLYFGGYQLPGSPPANNARADNESWNGTSWTELSDLSVARSSAASAINSPSTDTLVAGGDTWGPSPSPANATVETWNGTAWASGTNFNTARRAVMGAGEFSTSVLIYGGLGPPTGNASTEFWNGSSWTEVNDLATARSWASCNGTSPNALIAGGESPGYYNVTEEWTAVDFVINTLT